MRPALALSSVRPAFAALFVLAGCATAPGADSSSSAAAPPAPQAPETAAPPATTVPPVIPQFAAAAQLLDAEVHRAVAGGKLARADGYVYGQDLAALLLYAARRGDSELYTMLLPTAHQLIQQNPDDPYTNGFVLWRGRDGARPAQSGAAEALAMARALWAGGAAFGRNEDRVTALAILDGYAKHAYVLQGVWLARRSFDFAERSFANLSTLPAYQPDFLAEAEKTAGGKNWRGFAERSYSLLERAATPSRLLLPVIQPEVGATFPGAGLDVYAPNGLSSLEDSCLAVEGAASGLPKLAAGLLDFAVERAAKSGGRLRAYYSVEDGGSAGDAPLSANGYACLTRLAAARNHADALAVLDPRLLSEMQALAGAKGRAQLASAGSLLLAAQARGAF
jgi:hypothetical protein